MSYTVWVALGMVCAFLAAQLQPPDRSDVSMDQRQSLLLAAAFGAVGGAFLCEVPADYMGWAWRPAGLPTDALPLGGRTVLGGLLGGWLAVELKKWLLGIHGAMGDRFALPLAIALTCGRLGCASAGCCGGTPCDAWWAWHGRYPVQFIEALFHASAAIVLSVAAWRGLAVGQRLALYLTCYAALRFTLEWWRGNPVILLGLTWYQYLALALFMLAGGTWLARRCRPPPLAH